jgi:hypothetical protein
VNLVFELAPRSRRHDWDKALAFAIAPAAPSVAAIYFFTESPALAAAVGTVGLIGTFLCAITLASTPLGRIALTRDALVLDSGFLHARVPLAELDLAAARLGTDATASLRLSTRDAHAVTIPRRTGPALVVTPLDRDTFLATLKTLST